MMKNRIIKTDFAALLNQAWLLWSLAFAVIVAAFRCSGFRFPCYRLSAKATLKTLIALRNISNKFVEKHPKKISFPVLSLFRLGNSESGRIRAPPDILQFGNDVRRLFTGPVVTTRAMPG